MTKWEYRVVPVHASGKPISGNLDWMDEMGAEGWECYVVDEGIAYFRRPKKSVPVRVGPTEHKTPSKGPSV